jgi:hypothetical protein
MPDLFDYLPDPGRHPDALTGDRGAPREMAGGGPNRRCQSGTPHQYPADQTSKHDYSDDRHKSGQDKKRRTAGIPGTGFRLRRNRLARPNIPTDHTRRYLSAGRVAEITGH